MIELEINKKIVAVPENWQELNQATMLALAQVYFAETMPLLDKLSWVLGSQLGLKKKEMKNADAAYVYLQLEANGVFEKMMFLLSSPVDEVVVAGDEYFEQKEIIAMQQLLPTVQCGDDELIAPDNDFSNLVFIELLVADDLFMRWQQTNDDDWLARFFGCLWRIKDTQITDKNYKGDWRKEFNESIITTYGLRVGKVSKSTMLAAALWWLSNRIKLAATYKFVYEPSDADGAEDAESMAQQGTTVMLQSIAESGVFGKLAEVKMSNALECFTYLNSKIAANKKAAKTKVSDGND